MNYYQIDLPISKKKIYVRDWNVREDNELAKELQSIDRSAKDCVIQENKVIMNFVKNHLKSPEIFDELNILDFRYIQIALHNGSKGNIKEIRFQCLNDNVDGKKCSAYEQTQENKLDIVNDIKFPSISKKEQIDISDKLIITIKNLPLVKQIEFIEKIFNDDKYKISDFKFDCIIASIDGIIESGQIKEMTFEEKKKYIGEELKPKEMKLIVSAYNKINDDLEITKKNKCIKCGNETNISIGGFSFFI